MKILSLYRNQTCRRSALRALRFSSTCLVSTSTISFGRGERKAEASKLRVGLTREEGIALLGKPADTAANLMEYPDGTKTLKVFRGGKRKSPPGQRKLPGGAETIIV